MLLMLDPDGLEGMTMLEWGIADDRHLDSGTLECLRP